jgi:hypothetical protein
VNNSEDVVWLARWVRELEARGTRPEWLAWRLPDAGTRAMDDQVSGASDLMMINVARRDENLNNGVVAWTDDELHVMHDADGGGCNVMCIDGDCEL